MIELDSSLSGLRDLCREIAPDLRARAAAVDADPLDMAPHLDSPTLALLRAASTPEPFRTRDVPPHAGAYASSCLARVVANLELARGDAGILSANTGPSLAGLAVDALGSDEQRDLFYRALADGRTWSFFGMTEERHGSDATALETRLDRDPDGGHRLNGAKRYVANATRGAIGVVFARTGPGPLPIRAVLLRRPAPGLTGGLLEMSGLRGACIGAMAFDEVPVTPGTVLGAHLPASRRGLWGASRAFNVMRVQIAAQALGVGYAAHDLVRAQRPGWPGGELLRARLDGARALLHDVAAGIDHAPDDRRPPSVAKLHATRLATEVVERVEHALGPGSLLEHPLLEKWCRDVHAFEFMDGTSNILRLHIAPTGVPRPAAT
ncbi:acyl-CoA dehydrogenase [Streptomyces sp. SID4919]|uniref:acyl-CoA dehydrogenase family protein n=1 Tax=unclassified Streptomyces TaxID=2593676 RepID=UPI000823B5DA|nr:acyl-CoA dehydrogenase family protein [Streptomyces sp. AmelKG-E11A]MYY08079.1 acyl-CoA dehydrogenase [Streptomyces sp. SID4919]SCK08698.1 Acyl-CoA dehydrogenase [Streptomyces sp. AmelKG-E11A]